MRAPHRTLMLALQTALIAVPLALPPGLPLSFCPHSWRLSAGLEACCPTIPAAACPGEEAREEAMPRPGCGCCGEELAPDPRPGPLPGSDRSMPQRREDCGCCLTIGGQAFERQAAPSDSVPRGEDRVPLAAPVDLRRVPLPLDPAATRFLKAAQPPPDARSPTAQPLRL